MIWCRRCCRFLVMSPGGVNNRAGILRRQPQSLEKCVPNIQKKSEDNNVEKFTITLFVEVICNEKMTMWKVKWLTACRSGR